MAIMDEMIRNGDLAGVQHAVEEDAAALDAALEGGATPLQLAIALASPAIAGWLLGQGAGVDLRDGAGRTALMIAAGSGRAFFVEMLLARDADVSLQDGAGRTALMCACSIGKPDSFTPAFLGPDTILKIVTALLSRNAKVNCTTEDGWTVLMHACHNGHSEVIDTLVEAGAALDLQTNAGWTALMLAFETPGEGMQANLSPTIVEERALRCVSLLWAAGADLRLRRSDGLDALAMAERSGKASVYAFLRHVTASKLVRLLLENLEVSRKAILALFEAFNLVEENVDESRIGDAGARVLAHVLADNDTLKTIDLSNNGIGTAGAQALAHALTKNKTLVEIDLRGNALGNEDAEALALALEGSSTLQRIWLDDDTIDLEILERIHRHRLRPVRNDSGRTQVFVRQARQVAALSLTTTRCRAARAKQLAFYKFALHDCLSDLARLADLFAGLDPFERRVQEIEERFENFQRLQKAVIGDAGLAPQRNLDRTFCVECIIRVMSDGLEAKVADLAAWSAAPHAKCVRTSCFRVSMVLLGKPVENLSAAPSLAEVHAAGRALKEALAAWEARHTVPSAHDARDVLETLALGEALPDPDLVTKVATLEQALREELTALRSTSPKADPPLGEAESALRHLFSFASTRMAADRWHRKVVFLNAHLPSLLVGLAAPEVAPLQASLDKLRRARRALERLKLDFEYAQGELGPADSETAGMLVKRAAREVYELDSTVCLERTRILRYAAENYPELLNDRAWHARIGISQGALDGVGKRSLWFDDFLQRDFTIVGPLADRKASFSTEKVRDRSGREFVRKAFSLVVKGNHARFNRQVQTLSTVDSAYVVPLEGLYLWGCTWACFLMPFFPGGDLETWIRGNPAASVETRKRIAVGILTGVRDLHQRGLVHCKIKPAKILLSQGLSPAIGPFDGFAQQLDDVEPPATADLFYMAPELRARGAQEIGPPADMYSVGVILNELFPEATGPRLAALIASLMQESAARRPSALEALQDEALYSDPAYVLACAICLENRAATEGACCSAGHFTCNACLSETVRAAAQDGAYVRVSHDGSLQCVAPDCAHRLSSKTLAACVPEEEFAAVLGIVRGLFEQDAAREQEEEVRRRVEAALREHGLETETQNHLRAIQEEVLTMACPRCSTAFCDFDGCCALKCLKCPCYFCAWCLHDAGNVAALCHKHVAHCSARATHLKDPVFSPLEVVQTAWATLRAQRVRAYLAEKITDPGVRATVREKLLPLLTPDIVGDATF